MLAGLTRLRQTADVREMLREGSVAGGHLFALQVFRDLHVRFGRVDVSMTIAASDVIAGGSDFWSRHVHLALEAAHRTAQQFQIVMVLAWESSGRSIGAYLLEWMVTPMHDSVRVELDRIVEDVLADARARGRRLPRAARAVADERLRSTRSRPPEVLGSLAEGLLTMRHEEAAFPRGNSDRMRILGGTP